jgi:hypothetical protein
MKTGCIITRYNETIDWIEYIQSKIDIFYIYNKGDNDTLFKKEVPQEWAHKIKIMKLNGFLNGCQLN